MMCFRQFIFLNYYFLKLNIERTFLREVKTSVLENEERELKKTSRGSEGNPSVFFIKTEIVFTV